MDVAAALIAAAQELREVVDSMKFGPPVSVVYNPLAYAWDCHAKYLRRYGAWTRPVVFVGMNPGPFGMAQTGVPFGEVAAVRDWLRLHGDVRRPAIEHPKRPVQGLACTRSEVSGRRLWGLFAHRFGTADAFFEDHFVANYCPLVFMTETGANLTPDKLPLRESQPLEEACTHHLRRVLEALASEWVVGVGSFATERARAAADGLRARVVHLLHPSPASPAANRGWAEQATKTLEAAGIWKSTVPAGGGPSH